MLTLHWSILASILIIGFVLYKVSKTKTDGYGSGIDGLAWIFAGLFALVLIGGFFWW